MNTTSICALNLKQLNQTLDIATPAGGILPLLIGASRDPASHLLLLKVMRNYRRERYCNMSTHRRGGANNVMSPSSLFDITVMVQQIYLLTKAATLAVHEHQSSNVFTPAYLGDWCQRKFIFEDTGVISEWEEYSVKGGECGARRQGKTNLLLEYFFNTMLYSGTIVVLREFKWQLTLMEEM